jgi:hypothetical protein
MNENTARDPRARLGEYLIPPKARPVLCKSCQHEIVWILTSSGANMPLSLATVRQDTQGRRWALTHFADCPQAAQHRTSPVGAIRESPSGRGIDLRDLPYYLERNHLVVTGSTVSDDGKGKLTIVLQTRKLA